MKRPLPVFLAVLTWASSFSVYAQDLLGSTNTATRSYNYIEIKYLTDVDSDLPIWAGLVFELKDQWSFWSEFRKQDFKNVGAELSQEIGVVLPDDTNASGQLLSVGLLYHDEFTRIADTDWVAGLRLGQLDAEIELLGETFKSDADFYEAYIGLRRSLSPKMEGEAGLELYAQEDTDKIYTGSLQLVYRVRPSIDVALAMDEIGEEEEIAIGLRYTW